MSLNCAYKLDQYELQRASEIKRQSQTQQKIFDTDKAYVFEQSNSGFYLSQFIPWLTSLKRASRQVSIHNLLPLTQQYRLSKPKLLNLVLDKWSNSLDGKVQAISNLLKDGLQLSDSFPLVTLGGGASLLVLTVFIIVARIPPSSSGVLPPNPPVPSSPVLVPEPEPSPPVSAVLGAGETEPEPPPPVPEPEPEPPVSVLESEPSPPVSVPEVLGAGETEAVFRDYIDAWNGGDVDRQAQYLSEDFESRSFDQGIEYDKLNYSDYIQEKRSIAQSRQPSISTSQERIDPNGDGFAIVTYYQQYKNSAYQSLGTNQFYLRKRNGRIEIYKEIFNRDSHS